MTRVLIPARKGSKGIENKNMFPIGGKPMIYYSISEAKKILDEEYIFVSSDSDEILDYSNKMGVRTIKRPKNISDDLSTSADVIRHFIDQKNLRNNLDTKIVYLQPSSPLRRSEHIEESLKLFEKTNAISLISVSESIEYPSKIFTLNDGFLEYMVKGDKRVESRQSLDTTYYPNGAIYIFRIGAFIKNNVIPQNRIKPYIMSKLDSVDIDDIIDLEQAERILNARK